MSDNLLTIGTSGVLASNSLLNTTSNNIANLNTKGFTRQSTEHNSAILGLGVGRGVTDRLVNEFTLKQLRRDTSNLSYAEQYLAEASRVDSLFSNTANSIAKGMTDMFKQLQTANNDPANNSARQLFLGSGQTLVNKFNTLSSLVLEQGSYINQQLDIFVSEANTISSSIASLNKEISGYGKGPSTPPPLDLLDKRDEAIRKLSELMEVQTLEAANGEKLVFLSSGQSLVLQDGKFNALSAEGDPDFNRKIVKLELDFNPLVTDTIDSSVLGGKIGGLLDFRSSMLEPMQNKLGQMAFAIGDAFNSQNRLGMDANSIIGKDLFVLGGATGLPMDKNTGLGQVRLVVEPGEGKNIPPNDLKVTFNSPNQVVVEALDNDGKVINGSAITQTINAAGNVIYGYRITMDSSGGAFANNDSFQLKPLGKAAQNIALATTRPEDVALASPVKGEYTIANQGNARFGNITVTDTDSATSQFNPTGTGINGAPFTVTFINGNQFEIRNSSNTVIVNTAVMPSGQYKNLMASAGLANYGFDFSLTGIPKNGDTFTIDFNTAGYKDNRNGLALAGLQGQELVRKNAVSSATADNSLTLNESYGSMIGFIGEKTSQSRIAAESSKSLLAQSTTWYESTSGVNLDEEAANLIRFQQSYAAAAKIISTSQTIFDTLLSAAR
jgi:flagellar hook-associated protein 1 FlgK